jgi:hypothetical protein
MQFYAIEIARYVPPCFRCRANTIRNRAGLNDWVYETEHPKEAPQAKS